MHFLFSRRCLLLLKLPEFYISISVVTFYQSELFLNLTTSLNHLKHKIAEKQYVARLIFSRLSIPRARKAEVDLAIEMLVNICFAGINEKAN